MSISGAAMDSSIFFLIAWLHKISGSGDAFYDHILFHITLFTLNTLTMHITNQLTCWKNKGTPELALHCSRKWWWQHLLQIIDVQNVLTFNGHASWLWTVFVSAWTPLSICPSPWLETHSQSTPSHRHHPAPRAIQTQPLSNHVLRACADQRARQRKMGIAKKLAKAFDNYLAKEGCLEDPFSKQILRNYQPCVSTPRTLEQRKECVNQQNTVNHNSCPILLSCNFGGTSH